MSNLSAFMHANVEQIENYKFAASPVSRGGWQAHVVGNLLHLR